MRDVTEAAVKRWGIGYQIPMVIEECSELITVLCHYERGRVSADAIADEIADVSIMLDQLRVMFGDAAVDAAIARKLERLRKRLEADHV